MQMIHYYIVERLFSKLKKHQTCLHSDR